MPDSCLECLAIWHRLEAIWNRLEAIWHRQRLSGIQWRLSGTIATSVFQELLFFSEHRQFSIWHISSYNLHRQFVTLQVISSSPQEPSDWWSHVVVSFCARECHCVSECVCLSVCCKVQSLSQQCECVNVWMSESAAAHCTCCNRQEAYP